MATDTGVDGESSTRFSEEIAVQRRNLHPVSALKLMKVRASPHRLRTRPRLGRRATSAASPVDVRHQPEEPAQRPAAPQARERAAGGPEDRAAYRCTCGYVFEAPVSTTVGCPHCGGTQAW